MLKGKFVRRERSQKHLSKATSHFLNQAVFQEDDWYVKRVLVR